ncbi:hypothetical protein CW748_16995 [Alteromonadales bacterium alter-6D02]|nr:hypothetical protein CW748_16995 [Alteromonadales bacterium alter-6D02]
MCLIVVLAITANTPAHAINNAPEVTELTIVPKQQLTNASSNMLFKLLDQQEQSSSEDIYNPPRFYRANVSCFLAEAQQQPQYGLVCEFFEPKLSAALYKNLITPPKLPHWFEQTSFKKTTSRISGWKDANMLYTTLLDPLS